MKVYAIRILSTGELYPSYASQPRIYKRTCDARNSANYQLGHWEYIEEENSPHPPRRGRVRVVPPYELVEFELVEILTQTVSNRSPFLDPQRGDMIQITDWKGIAGVIIEVWGRISQDRVLMSYNYNRTNGIHCGIAVSNMSLAEWQFEAREGTILYSANT